MNRKLIQKIVGQLTDEFHEAIRKRCIENTPDLEDAFDVEEQVIKCLSVRAKK